MMHWLMQEKVLELILALTVLQIHLKFVPDQRLFFIFFLGKARYE